MEFLIAGIIIGCVFSLFDNVSRFIDLLWRIGFCSCCKLSGCLIVYRWSISVNVDSSCRVGVVYVCIPRSLYQFGSVRSLKGVVFSFGLLEYNHRF